MPCIRQRLDSLRAVRWDWSKTLLVSWKSRQSPGKLPVIAIICTTTIKSFLQMLSTELRKTELHGKDKTRVNSVTIIYICYIIYKYCYIGNIARNVFCLMTVITHIDIYHWLFMNTKIATINITKRNICESTVTIYVTLSI